VTVSGEAKTHAGDAGEHTDGARERTGGVLGILLGLGLLLGALAALVSFAAQTLGGADSGRAGEIGRAFGTEPPFGLSLAETARFPDGKCMVIFRRSEAAQALELPSDAPTEVVFIAPVSLAAAKAYLSPSSSREEGPGSGERETDGVESRMRDWEEDPAKIFHATIKQGDLAWSTHRAIWLVERAFEADGTWRDAARVNLSQEDRPLVLFVHFAPETPAEEARVKELLGAIDLELLAKQG
jgi:hypothetical protein